jgi:hypothetical protein
VISRAAFAITVAALTATVSAQIGGKPVTGNPTPGTAQPDPPNLADRVTLSGCLQAVTRRADASASAKAPADKLASAEANTRSNARYELIRAERVDRVPPGTGGSPATSVSSKSYRLEGIDSQFSPFVGAKVEISGEIRPPSVAEKAAPPTLLVEFVQKIAGSCS